MVIVAVGGAMLWHLAQNVTRVTGTPYRQAGLVLGLITFAGGVAAFLRRPPKISLPLLTSVVVGIFLLYHLFGWFARQVGIVVVPSAVPPWIIPAFAEGGLGWVVGGGAPTVVITLVAVLFGLAAQADED